MFTSADQRAQGITSCRAWRSICLGLIFLLSLLSTSCAVFKSDLYVAPGRAAHTTGWKLKPYVWRLWTLPPPGQIESDQFKVVVRGFRQGDETALDPVIDSVILGVDGLHPIRLLVTGTTTTSEDEVRFDFDKVRFPLPGDSLYVRIFSMGDIAESTEPIPMARVVERYLGAKPDKETGDSVRIDPLNYDEGFDFHSRFRWSRKIYAASISGFGFAGHLGSGDWTWRATFSLIEFWRKDSVVYPTSAIFPAAPPPATFDAPFVFLAGFLTPDFTIERNLDRAHRWKLFGGLDWTLNMTNFADWEDFHTGMLLSPRVGVQIPISLFRVRLYGSENYWWRFAKSNLDLGWTLGVDLIYTGKEFGI